MSDKYSSGVAFVLEGDTEKVFYFELLEHFCKKHRGSFITRQKSASTGEIEYVITTNEKKVLVKTNVVGTISQIANSGAWFENRCYSEHKDMIWTIFLCYDTDNYLDDITKFSEGDWKELRKTIKKHKKCNVIDLAASADIEDTMLIDSDSVFRFLGLPPGPVPNGSKGKKKMKKIYRLKGPTYGYHSGDRSRALIRSLDFDKIIACSPIPLKQVDFICFGQDLE